MIKQVIIKSLWDDKDLWITRKDFLKNVFSVVASSQSASASLVNFDIMSEDDASLEDITVFFKKKEEPLVPPTPVGNTLNTPKQQFSKISKTFVKRNDQGKFISKIIK
jgi:molybdenum cofactor biosynthesis enzyme MoaA